MALYFHEGLPGAGKSYEACVYHILPALKEGRQVITNIRGINYEKFAQLLDEPEEYVRLLLIYVEPAEQDGQAEDIETVKNAFANSTPDNAMIVWDEIQDYFPSGNYKLPINQQKFWTEHRHRGLDIVIMGQDRDDVHKIIRSRIEAITYFLKLKAVGKPSNYKWEHYEKQAKGKFVKIGSGVREYDSLYFGLYMSHRREGVRSKVYQTGRTNVLANTKMLSWGVPIAFVGAFYAIYHLYGFFNPEPVKSKPSTAVSSTPKPPSQVQYSRADPATAQASSSTPNTSKPADPEEPEPIDYLDRLAQQYLVRAAAVITSDVPGRELMAQIELLDDTFRLKEIFSVAEIRALGWTVTNTGYGILLEKQGIKHIARAWPLDINGRVDQRTQNSLRDVPQPSGWDGVQAQRQPSRVTIVGDNELANRPWR